MRTSMVLLLCLTLAAWSRADYPPHDLSYRVHYHDLYPKEVPKSNLCIGRKNGAYPHHELDLGDPRCTYVVCSNARPVIQSCPRGTRTMHDVKPSTLARALLSRLQRHGYRDNTIYSYSDMPRRNLKDGAAGAPGRDGVAAAGNAENQIGTGVSEPYRGYAVHVYSPLYFNHKMCNIHDVSGVCGEPFPDLNAYSNEVPKSDLVAH